MGVILCRLSPLTQEILIQCHSSPIARIQLVDYFLLFNSVYDLYWSIWSFLPFSLILILISCRYWFLSYHSRSAITWSPSYSLDWSFLCVWYLLSNPSSLIRHLSFFTKSSLHCFSLPSSFSSLWPLFTNWYPFLEGCTSSFLVHSPSSHLINHWSILISFWTILFSSSAL